MTLTPLPGLGAGYSKYSYFGLGDLLRERIFQTQVEERPGSAAQLGAADAGERFGLAAGTSLTQVLLYYLLSLSLSL